MGALDILIRKRLLPYEDLLIIGSEPERYMELGKDISSVLANLVGNGPNAPRLVAVDDTGRLQIVTAAGADLLANIDQWGGGQVGAAVAMGDGASAAVISPKIYAVMGAFNNAGVDRVRSTSAANLANQSGVGGVLSASPGEWSVQSQPATGSQATASRAAGGAGVRHVCRSIDFSALAAVAPVATAMTVNVRDGATGAGTILRSFLVFVLAAIGQSVPPFGLSGLNLIGTAATAMTVEFATALANLNESTSFSGFDVS